MSLELAARLRKQAEELEQANKQLHSVFPNMQNTQTKDFQQPLQLDIQKMISEEVARQLPQIQQSTNNGATQIATKVVNPAAEMIQLIGTAFNEEQQLWISGNVSKLPDFIKSENGKAVLVMMFEEFQAFVKS